MPFGVTPKSVMGNDSESNHGVPTAVKNPDAGILTCGALKTVSCAQKHLRTLDDLLHCTVDVFEGLSNFFQRHMYVSQLLVGLGFFFLPELLAVDSLRYWADSRLRHENCLPYSHSKRRPHPALCVNLIPVRYAVFPREQE